MSVRDVFIVMPFTEQTIVTQDGERKYSEKHFDDIYATLRDAVREYNPDIHVDRMEQKFGNIVSHIIRRLHTADVVIAVLSGKNPNVFYELGVRHSLRRNTIMLVEYRDEYPFDLSGHYSEEFSVDHGTDRDNLKAFLRERLGQYDKESLPDSPVLEVLNQAEFEQMRALNAWETRRAAIVLHGMLGETGAFFNILNTCFEFIDMPPDDPQEQRPHMDLMWDMIEGFRQTRPMPGLPVEAYSDAENLYRVWKEMESLWNHHMESQEDPDPDVLLEVLSLPLFLTCAFLYDLTTAADYVITYKTTFEIPWGGSLTAAGDYEEMERLEDLAGRVTERAVPILQRLEEFDRRFTGVSPDASIKKSDKGIQAVETFHAVMESLGARRAQVTA